MIMRPRSRSKFRLGLNVSGSDYCLTADIIVVPYGDDSDGYYNVMSSEQQQQQQQQHQQYSPAAGESYHGVVSGTNPATTGTIDDEPTERELNLTLSAQPPATHVQ